DHASGRSATDSMVGIRDLAGSHNVRQRASWIRSPVLSISNFSLSSTRRRFYKKNTSTIYYRDWRRGSGVVVRIGSLAGRKGFFDRRDYRKNFNGNSKNRWTPASLFLACYGFFLEK